MEGTVTAFDADRGYGTIKASDGRELFFHCTQLVDGSRSVDIGADVQFDIVAGHRGRYEAVAVDAAARRASS